MNLGLGLNGGFSVFISKSFTFWQGAHQKCNHVECTSHDIGPCLHMSTSQTSFTPTWGSRTKTRGHNRADCDLDYTMSFRAQMASM